MADGRESRNSPLQWWLNRSIVFGGHPGRIGPSNALVAIRLLSCASCGKTPLKLPWPWLSRCDLCPVIAWPGLRFN